MARARSATLAVAVVAAAAIDLFRLLLALTAAHFFARVCAARDVQRKRVG